jgi:hypothetical protein
MSWRNASPSPARARSISSADTAAAWEAWFDQLGSHLVDLGNPVFERTPVGTCGTPLPLGGYTLITANDFAEALELARGCPVVPAGGGVEVGLLTPVPGREHPARIF